MKFIVNSTALLKELQKLNGVISSNNTLPILDNFLFEISSNKMSIVASDLETTMISSISVTIFEAFPGFNKADLLSRLKRIENVTGKRFRIKYISKMQV